MINSCIAQNHQADSVLIRNELQTYFQKKHNQQLYPTPAEIDAFNQAVYHAVNSQMLADYGNLQMVSHRQWQYLFHDAYRPKMGFGYDIVDDTRTLNDLFGILWHAADLDHHHQLAHVGDEGDDLDLDVRDDGRAPEEQSTIDKTQILPALGIGLGTTMTFAGLFKAYQAHVNQKNKTKDDTNKTPQTFWDYLKTHKKILILPCAGIMVIGLALALPSMLQK
jgi:hypothetical protein